MDAPTLFVGSTPATASPARRPSGRRQPPSKLLEIASNEENGKNGEPPSGEDSQLGLSPASLPVLTAPTLETFRAGLLGRDRFPERRLQEFVELSDIELTRAIENTREVRLHLERVRARGFNDALRSAWYSDASGMSGAADQEATLDLGLFSCDHAWRAIAQGLNLLVAAFEARMATYLDVALERYIAYLHSRESRLGELLSRRRR